MNTVPREAFVLDSWRDQAYADSALPIPANQTISQPYIVALMISNLHVQPEHRVLEIGSGSGYAAALLSRMVREVYGIERHAELVAYSQARLQRLGYENVRIWQGNGSLGWPDKAPFNGILVSAGGPVVPPQLREQLIINGRLVMPIGPRLHHQTLVCVTRKSANIYISREIAPVAFVPLIGVEGWSKELSYH